MITAIVIPVDPLRPLQQEEISPSDIDAYRRIIGGPLELVPFERPRASLYVHEEGKLEPFAAISSRATLLSWVHHSALRARDVIVGDTLLVGPPDQDGLDTSVPDAYVELLFTATTFTVEVQVHGDERWYSNDKVFDDALAAYGAAVDLAQRWAQVVHLRVVPVATGG